MNRDELIAEAARAILKAAGIEPEEDGRYWGEGTWPNAVKDAAAALAVFEKAHVSTDQDETPDPPEAPEWWSTTEAAAWEQGWTSGYSAARTPAEHIDASTVVKELEGDA